MGDRDDHESELIASICSGETQLFRILVDRNKDIVFKMILRQVRDEHIAEELTQETFLKAFRSLRQFRGESTFRSWIIRIGLNNSCSYFSSRAYRQKVNSESYDPELHSDSIAPGAALKDRFYRAFSELKPTFQQVVSICALEGKSYEEAAEILEIPIGTVRSRLHKARILLATALGSNFEGASNE